MRGLRQGLAVLLAVLLCKPVGSLAGLLASSNCKAMAVASLSSTSRSAARAPDAATTAFPAGIRDAEGACPINPGYNLINPGKEVPASALVVRASANNITAASIACGQRPDCRGFTSGGLLVLSDLDVTVWADSSDPTSCVYVRASLTGG
eukprot:XP_001689543.1 predicted protein [Chlamydomonas reinhardtii]